MTEFRNLYAGFDGLDVAFQGRLAKMTIRQLEKAREDAQTSGCAVVVALGPGGLKAEVFGYGKQGFRYRWETGPEGVIWWATRSDDREGWNLFCSVHSAAFLARGGAGVRAMISADLRAMGAEVITESVNRVDFATDFLMPDGWAPDPEGFVARGRARRTVHGGEERSQAGDGFLVHWSGRRITSVTIGSMPNRQVCCYNKRAEIIASRKDYWWQAWGLDPAEKPNVWRVEMRAGKEELKEEWGVTTLASLDEKMADIWAALTRSIRLTVPKPDTNCSRWRTDPFWDAVRAAVVAYYGRDGDPALRGVVIRTTRARLVRTIEEMWCGMAATAAVALGKDDPAALARHMAGVVETVESARWQSGQRRAREKYTFICEEGPHGKERHREARL